MRIAIAAMTRNEDAKVSLHGARATCYLVYDETGTLCEVVENPFKDSDRAVGVRVADHLAERSVDVLAAARFGAGFARALDAKGIRRVESKGIVRKVAGELAGCQGPA